MMSNPFDLTGRCALVTGGGRGLGLGISQATVKRYLAKALASICKSVSKDEGKAAFW